MWVSKVHSGSLATRLEPKFVVLIIMVLVTTYNVDSSVAYGLTSSRQGRNNWSSQRRIAAYPNPYSSYSSGRILSPSANAFHTEDHLMKRDSGSSQVEANTNLASLNHLNMEPFNSPLDSNLGSSINVQGHTKQMLDEWGIPMKEGEVNQHNPQEPSYGHVELQPLPDYYPHQSQYHHHHYDEEEKELIEVEDKVFSKTVVATKALKVGKFVFTFAMVLVVFVLAGLAKLGVPLSPAILPLTLIPLGIIALLLFIPLFLVFVPIVAAGLGGGKKRRKRRSAALLFQDFETRMDKCLIVLQQVLTDEFTHNIGRIQA